MSWPRVVLSHVCEMVTDGTHASPVRVAMGVPVLSAQNVKGNELNPSTLRFTTQDELILFQRRVKPKAGDVLLTIVGTIGRSAVLTTDFDFVLQRSVAILRTHSHKVNSDYLKLALDSGDFQRQLLSATNSSAQAGVYLGKLSKLTIPLPPLPEQRRIATILDQADNLRINRRFGRNAIDQIAGGVFAAMFGDPIETARDSQAMALELVTEAIIDCPHTTPIWTQSGNLCIRTPNLGRGEWDLKDARYVSNATHATRTARGALNPGDIILSREGTIGVGALVPAEMKASMGQRLVQVKPKALVTDGEFLLAYLLEVLRPDRLTRLMVGSTVLHLNVRDLRNLKVLVPPIDKQIHFASVMKKLRKLQEAHRRHSFQLDELFASLQHRAFRGEL